MSIKDKINDLMVKLRFATKKPTDEQFARYIKLKKDVLSLNAEDLKKSGRKVYSDFSYGPDGPEQQMWETTKLLDDGSVYKRVDFDNHGKKSSSVEMIIDGKFVSFPINDDKFSKLTIENNSGKFIETTFSELPKEIAKKIEETFQTAHDFSKKTEEVTNESELGSN